LSIFTATPAAAGGASHQTGWTGLIAQILIGLGEASTANDC
jgi:hypothetical protein